MSVNRCCNAVMAAVRQRLIDLAKTVGLAERHVSRQLRLAYLAPGDLKRLVDKREVPAVTLLQLTDIAALPWHEQPERLFD
jgi:hypothetical protein